LFRVFYDFVVLVMVWKYIVHCSG